MRSIIFSIVLLHAFSINAQNFSTNKIKEIIKNEDTVLLDSMIDNGLDINKQYFYGKTILHFASFEQKVSIVKHLIHEGADLNIQNKDKWTALDISTGSVFRNDSISELLIKNGANVNLYDKISPLQQTVINKNENILKLLIEYGVEMNAYCSKCCDQSAFLYCCKFGNTNIFKILVENNADYNHKDCKGRNGLMYAIEAENIELISQLIQLEHNFNEIDNKGRTILEYATKTKNAKIIEIIENYIKK